MNNSLGGVCYVLVMAAFSMSEEHHDPKVTDCRMKTECELELQLMNHCYFMMTQIDLPKSVAFLLCVYFFRHFVTVILCNEYLPFRVLD